MTKKTCLLLPLLLITCQLFAQITEPVKWEFSQKKISDNEIELIFKAKIDAKWHLYTQYFEAGGPMRLSFNFEESENYQKTGKVTEHPNPTKKFDDLFKINIQYLKGEATFKQRIKILSKNEFSIKGEIEGQACNDIDGSCVPLYPEFEFKIKGI